MKETEPVDLVIDCQDEDEKGIKDDTQIFGLYSCQQSLRAEEDGEVSGDRVRL